MKTIPLNTVICNVLRKIQGGCHITLFRTEIMIEIWSRGLLTRQDTLSKKGEEFLRKHSS